MIYLIIAVFAGMALILLPKLYKERKIKELIISGAFLFMGFVLSMLYYKKVMIPSPINALKSLLDMINLHY